MMKRAAATVLVLWTIVPQNAAFGERPCSPEVQDELALRFSTTPPKGRYQFLVDSTGTAYSFEENITRPLGEPTWILVRPNTKLKEFKDLRLESPASDSCNDVQLRGPEASRFEEDHKCYGLFVATVTRKCWDLKVISVPLAYPFEVHVGGKALGIHDLDDKYDEPDRSNQWNVQRDLPLTESANVRILTDVGHKPLLSIKVSRPLLLDYGEVRKTPRSWTLTDAELKVSVVLPGESGNERDTKQARARKTALWEKDEELRTLGVTLMAPE